MQMYLGSDQAFMKRPKPLKRRHAEPTTSQHCQQDESNRSQILESISTGVLVLQEMNGQQPFFKKSKQRRPYTWRLGPLVPTLLLIFSALLENANGYSRIPLLPAFQNLRSRQDDRIINNARLCSHARINTILKGHHSDLPFDPHTTQVPRHVAFICDGNSRWAKARGLPASAGHVAGADRLVKILDTLKASGVMYCTLYAFSTENWKRPPGEIQDLMRIMEESCHRFYNRAIQENVQVKILGDVEDERIPDRTRNALLKLEHDTAVKTAPTMEGHQQTSPFTVCFAINYGGRKDIMNASLKLATAIADQKLLPEDVTEEVFSSFLATRGIPDPDLVIRTSGECRLSNFLLWNIAYAELYFTNVLWPDFNQDSWNDALQWYSQRTRKFGGRKIKATMAKNGVTTPKGM